MNLFPREKPFIFNRGTCHTLHFVSAIGATIFGLLAGTLPRSSRPITLYCLRQLMTSFIRGNVRRYLGQHVFEGLGTAYAPILERAAVLLILWLILRWMYRRRVFLRI